MNPLLKTYFPIADMLTETFGADCEVVIHDLEQPDSSVVYVANGNVTNRQKGQAFDHLVRKVLLSKNFRDDRMTNYMFETEDGKKIKSSSVLIRNAEQDVIGMLCLNYNVTSYVAAQSKLAAFLDAEDVEPDNEKAVGQDIMAVIDELILNIIGTADVKNITRKRGVEIVKFMDEKGIFLVKGAIDKVAALMGVSKVTIYSYLDEAKGKRN